MGMLESEPLAGADALLEVGEALAEGVDVGTGDVGPGGRSLQPTARVWQSFR
jgi:hypothetical protein